MKKSALFLTFAAVFLLSLNSFAYRMCSATLILKSGDSLKGYVKLPIVNGDISLELFADENLLNAKKVESNAIRLLKLKYQTETAELIYAAATLQNGRILDVYRWWTIVAQTPKILVSVSYHNFELDKYGKFIGIFNSPTPNDYIHTILKREDLLKSDKIVGTFLTMISEGRLVLGGNAALRKNSKRFFSDCPVLVDKIEKKEFDNKIEDVQKMINFYDEKCMK